MKAPNLKKAGMLVLILVLTVIGSWEYYLRAQGLKAAYDDGEELWSDKRAMVYESPDNTTVFIGSSRIKHDIDIDTWQSLTGDHPIQLSIEGNSPLPVLDDLANDKNFKGKLVVDVTEFFFFSTDNFEVPKAAIAYYLKRTPAQRFSFLVNHLLESQFVFLDRDNFSLNSFLDKIPVHNRKGLFDEPFFPLENSRTTFDRQNIMMDKFLTDTVLQKQVTDIWRLFWHRDSLTNSPETSASQVDSILLSVKNSVDKIKSKGGKVLFVRPPSSGPQLIRDKRRFLREKYWDRILTITNCPGIHFSDYPVIDHFQCPDWGHLGRPDAIIFTKNIIKIMQEEKGWSFPNKQTSL